MYMKVMTSFGISVLAVFVGFFGLLVVHTVYPSDEAQRTYTYEPDEYWGSDGGNAIYLNGAQSYESELVVPYGEDEPTDCLTISADRTGDGVYYIRLYTECDSSDFDYLEPDVPRGYSAP